MDYNILLDLATDLGYELAMSGAETFRVEDSIERVLNSYHVSAEVFAIPNFLIVGIITDTGKPLTRMRRIGNHGNNLDAVERLNALSRKICQETPVPTEAKEWLNSVCGTVKKYSFPVILAGDFMGAAGFSTLFGCSLSDALCAGFCGIIIGVVVRLMNSLKSNPLFTTFAGAFFMASIAYMMKIFGIIQNTDSVVIGALMLLVPGLLFTNSLRDIIYGDINSGINRLVQVVLIAAALAMGTAFAWNFISMLSPIPESPVSEGNPLVVTSLTTFIGCIGFSILFNIHGPGGLLCAAGGIITWLIYSVSMQFGIGELMAYFWGTFFAAVYSEVMARIRKYPAISYLVVSIFPLIPGAGVYFAMQFALRGNMQQFVSQGMYTAAIAGTMAISILLVSTIVRMYTTWINTKK